MEVFDPSGATEVTADFADRLETLDGRKIGLVSNQMWQADRALALLKEQLEQRHPTATLVLIPAADRIQSDEMIDAIAREGYDAVIVGAAA
jgi:hypothetical protein